MTTYRLVEKNDPNALHGIFDTLERAQHHLANVIPTYVAKGYFMDKTLTHDSFTIVPSRKA